MTPCEACVRCADQNCRRSFCSDWDGWQDAEGAWFCQDHLEPTEPAAVA